MRFLELKFIVMHMKTSMTLEHHSCYVVVVYYKFQPKRYVLNGKTRIWNLKKIKQNKQTKRQTEGKKD